MQFWKISTNAAPWWACAAFKTSGRFFDTSIPRPTNRAPLPSAKAQGLAGWSTEPIGLVGERVPSRLVGEYWPLVRP